MSQNRRGRGAWRGNKHGKRRHFQHRKDEGDINPEWQENVRENRDAVDLEFKDYKGQKIHELPEDFLQVIEGKKEDVLQEKDFGITEYVDKKVEGFAGILKHRYSDFVVHEIDLEGNVIKLTDLELPASSASKQAENLTEKSLPDYSKLEATDKTLLSQLSWTRLNQMVVKLKDNPNLNDSKVKIDVSNKTKEERKDLHGVIKKLCPMLDSNTSQEGDKKFVEVFPRKNAEDPNAWPRDRPKHLTFHLCKEGTDAVPIFGQMSRELRIHNSKFKVAGTKDRRGVTTQKVAVSWVTAEKLKKSVRSFRGSGRVYVGNFRYCKNSLELGDLRGNHFTIALRDIDGSDQVIAKAVENLRDNGFINYFGQQRFGTASVKTSDIGLKLIKSQWSDAIELILKPRGNESPQMTRMRAHWWMYRKPKDAVILLGSRITQSKTIESTLLNGLAQEHENDLVNALSHLQKNTKLLYVHAYQAWIWNNAVSQRIQKYGLKVLVGDLVKSTDDSENDLVQEDGDEERSRIESVQAVTAETITKYSVTDVLMPIPGFKVSYPENEDLKKIYNDLLTADGLDQGFESLRHTVDMYSLPGAYRPIVVKPTDVSWKVVQHSDMNEDLLVSDIDIVLGKSPKEADENGSLRALVIDFTLPSSTYATMALREAMKIDMCKGMHSKRTDLIKNNDAQPPPEKKARVENQDTLG